MKSNRNIDKWLIGIFTLFFISGRSQNLIPNPGFEELFTQLEYQWVQPQGPYYHYEAGSDDDIDPPLGGNYVNGLCMYNTQPNEYLHAKLLEPLKAGVKYRLEVNARLMRSKANNAEIQRYIGVYFGKERYDTHIPGDLYVEPQLNLHLPDSDRFEWFQMVDTFTARGGEDRFTMGYFPKTQWLEHRELRQEALFERIEDRYKMEQAKKRNNEEMGWLYLPPDEQKKYLKEQKKKNKKKKNRPNSQSQMPDRNYGRDTSSLGYPTQRSENPEIFSVRYYFDQLCLSPIPIADLGATCRPENMQEVIAEGKTINLRNVFFETDSATLRQESIFQLKALERLMLDYPFMEIEIRGYTDDVGEATYNLDLSKRRAAAVSEWLAQNGIAQNRLASNGFGESNPIESNSNEAGRARNRRVTFYIKKL